MRLAMRFCGLDRFEIKPWFSAALAMEFVAKNLALARFFRKFMGRQGED
jgi:hypothetical protein